MAWDRTNPKYRSKTHRDYCAQLKAQLKRDGYLTCTAKECLFDTRDITNPDGRARDGLTAGHNDTGDAYDGPQHRHCNNHDAARRGHAAQRNTRHGTTTPKAVTTLQW